MGDTLCLTCREMQVALKARQAFLMESGVDFTGLSSIRTAQLGAGWSISRTQRMTNLRTPVFCGPIIFVPVFHMNCGLLRQECIQGEINPYDVIGSANGG